MSVHNGLPYIRESVPSILGQTFMEMELVVVDRASSDGTREYLRRVEQLAARVRVIYAEAELGESAALNLGLAACRGEWIACLNPDDVALPQRLERQLAFLSTRPDVAVTCCLAYYINARGVRSGGATLEPTSRAHFREYLAEKKPIQLLQTGVLMRLDVVSEAGGFREQFAAANGLDLWNRIADRGHLIVVQSEYLVEHRIYRAPVNVGDFVLSQLKYEWALDCMRARRAGRLEPDWETFFRDWEGAGWGTKLNRRRRIYARRYYGQGAESLISGNRVRSIGLLAMGFLLQPSYGLQQMGRQLLVESPAKIDTAFITRPVSGRRPATPGEPLPATVIIACHNAVRYVRGALESWLQQTRQPQTIIVVDDASTDGSSAILDEYAKTGAIRLIRNASPLGNAASVNAALELVSTKYIALMDADDVAAPNRLERQVAFMEARPKLGCTSAFIHYINSRGEIVASGILDLLTREDLKRYLQSDEAFGLYYPSVMLRAEVLRDPSLRFRGRFSPADDIDLWNRIAEAGWHVIAQPEFLTQYRIHAPVVSVEPVRNPRRQYEWVNACLRARRRAQPEPGYPEFAAERARGFWLGQFNSWRRCEARASYRGAGFAYCEGRYVHAMVGVFTAALLQPTYVARRLAQQMFEV
jgi:glycosyltransferase involved in cell wall biosynthesis